MQVASLNNITANLGGMDVLKGVSFTINSGERLGLIGANGSGKTTTLRVLMGEEEPSRGSVTLASETRLGYVPQYVDAGDDKLVIDWLLTEHIALGNALTKAENRMASATADETELAMSEYQDALEQYDRYETDRWPQRAPRILDSLGLTNKEDQKIGSLSGGGITWTSWGWRGLKSSCCDSRARS
jgi:ATPase subunit of ABC transporter with duplicated ATPase domains